jgi:hypothetical protein
MAISLKISWSFSVNLPTAFSRISGDVCRHLGLKKSEKPMYTCP